MTPHPATAAPQRSIEQLCDSMVSPSSTEALHAMWQVAEHGCTVDSPSPNTTVLCDVVRQQLSQLRLLVTENTALRTAPFRAFTSAVQELLRREADRYPLTTAARLSDLFAAYRRTPDHFVPLAETARVTTDGWGDFLFCSVPRTDAFFALASGAACSILVHFDQWFSSEEYAASLAARFAKQLSSIKEPVTVVLVTKELGPIGPEGLWDRIRPCLSTVPAVYRYDQATDSGKYDPCAMAPSRFVVLYDLIYSGDGLRQIERHLRSQVGATNVRHLILYDYSGGASPHASRLNVSPLYDYRTFPNIAPERLETIASSALPLQRSEGPFARLSLEDVDPGARQSSAPSRDAAWALTSHELHRHHAGKWVAIRNGTVLAVGDSYDELINAPSVDGAQRETLLCYVRPDDSDRNYVP